MARDKVELCRVTRLGERERERERGGGGFEWCEVVGGIAVVKFPV